MKKPLTYILCLFAGLIFGAAILLAVFSASGPFKSISAADIGEPDTVVDPETVTVQKLADLAFETVGYIKSGNYASLAKLVHPTYGLVFSPSATVNLRSNRCFSAVEVACFSSDNEKYIWGITPDDAAKTIELTPADYFQLYVYDNDYVSASVIGVDKIVKSGNSLENVTEQFPGAHFVDLCFPGTEAGEYQDWSTLRLVFESYDGGLRLTAVIHSEYTM